MQDELLLPPAILSPHDTGPVANCREEKSSTTVDVVQDNPDDDTRKRKIIIHKEVEKQRRQEMSTFYRSLRLLLPIEYLKGKRSISDHMHEDVRYIKHMQNKMKELKEKRDELKGSCPTRMTIPDVIASEYSTTSSPRSNVTAKPCRTGMELVVSTAVVGGMPLSKVLRILTAEGLTVVSCISTKVNEKLVHTIESEVNEGNSADPTKLQEKLTYSSAV